jgi:hypothetical protein
LFNDKARASVCRSPASHRIAASADAVRADVDRPNVASLAVMLDHKAIGFSRWVLTRHLKAVLGITGGL